MTSDPLAAAQHEIRGPSSEESIIEAWAADYIHFERRPAWQEQLRAELRNRLQALRAQPGQNLHATFQGVKLQSADVENLALYNIDDTVAIFANAARSGLSFEIGPVSPTSPAGRNYPYGYRFELRPTGSAFRYWQSRRELAAWDWVDLEGSPTLAMVWWAMARTRVTVASPHRLRDVPFGVRVAIRAPSGASPVLGRLLKGIIDGVICAFQAHLDTTTVTELAVRVARTLPAEPREVEHLLLDGDKAVLGSHAPLLYARGSGVQWNPADDFCLAGELLLGADAAPRWGLRGRLIELDEVRATADVADRQ